jgi:hypothetical protein
MKVNRVFHRAVVDEREFDRVALVHMLHWPRHSTVVSPQIHRHIWRDLADDIPNLQRDFFYGVA